MTGKILVADDSPNIREILQMNLETLGYEVITAEDGERALQQFGKEHPDLMIVDVMMPKINGFQICRKVKSNPATQATPVILLTARSQQEDVFWGKDCGADEYVTKPFSTKELEKTIARLLKRRQDQQAGRATGVRDEQRRRQAQGQASRVVLLQWEPRALDIFRKKYGEIKFSEMQGALREEAEKFLEGRNDHGPVDLHETAALAVVLNGGEAEALKGGQDLAARLNTLAGRFYTSDDWARGHIPFRDPRTGREENLPLLSFTARLEEAAAA
jgi:DNA-binding response OmpR family regulator